MPQAGKIEAVVFDVGRVLFHWQLRALFEKLIDDVAANEAASAVLRQQPERERVRSFHSGLRCGVPRGRDGARSSAIGPSVLSARWDA